MENDLKNVNWNLKVIAVLLCVIIAILYSDLQAQNGWDNWKLKSPEKEFMFLETHWDLADIRPGDDSNDKLGIHYGIEFGMRSNLGRNTFGVEAKVLHENFPQLLGGYTVFGGGAGIYFVVGANEQIMYYAGARLMPWVYRDNPSTGLNERSENIGLELKWTYTFSEKFYLGLRYVYESANDIETIDRDLVEEIRYTVNLVIGVNISRIGGYKKKH